MLPSDFREKVTTLAIVIGAAVLVAGAIYTYERYYRETDAVFYGTWQEIDPMIDASGGASFLEFRPDHTFSEFLVTRDGQKMLLPGRDGRWYAGGQNLYFRWGGTKAEPDTALVPLRFDMSPDHLTIRPVHGGVPIQDYKRVADSR